MGPPRVSVRRHRIWKHRRAMDELLRGRRCSGRLLQVVLGHWTWAMMLQRSTLSIFSATDAFARKHGSRVAERWPSVCWELGTAAWLLPLLTVDLSLPWRSALLASDASEYGCGVCELQSGADALAQVGRIV